MQKGVSSVGVGAHITAAAKGGPRYNAKLTAVERRSAKNAIWLCNNCGRLVDNDTSTYTVAQLRKWKRDAITRAQRELASGGRSTTEGLAAAQLALQKETLAHQKQTHEAQIREQQRSKFSEMYTHFLQEAKAYADAIDKYWTWMHKTLFRQDRPTREAMQKPVRDARDALERALQPILLSDDDETRGTLRWELLRGRGLEPVIDTIENQKDYSEVIHYHHLRFLDGINRLQSNVRQALGLPVRTPSAQMEEFEAQMLERAKATAEAVEARLKAQYDDLMSAHHARSGSSATALTNSPSGNDIRNRVWNVLHVEIFEDEEDVLTVDRGDLTLSFVREIWRDVLGLPIDEVPNNYVDAWKTFREVLMGCSDKTFYAIVQHAAGDRIIRERLGDALERAGAPFRFVGDELQPAD